MIARMLTIGRDHLTKAEAVTILAIETKVPALNAAREMISRFQTMVRAKSPADLDPWLKVARDSLVGSFAHGIAKDRAAVQAAMTKPWSNGQTEGQVNRLKVIKRQMYGRAKLDLLEARLVGAR